MRIPDLIDLIMSDVVHSVIVRPQILYKPYGQVIAEVHYLPSADPVVHWERVEREYRKLGPWGVVLKMINVTCSSCCDRLAELEPALWGCGGCGGMFDQPTLELCSIPTVDLEIDRPGDFALERGQ